MCRLISSILLIFFLCSIFSILPTVYANPDGWVSPTGNESTSWGTPSNAYDDNTDTLASSFFTSDTLVLTHSALTCNKIRFWCMDAFGYWFTVDVYKDGSWVNVYNGGGLMYWIECSFSQGSVSKIRFTPNINSIVLCYEADFWEVSAPPTKEWHDVVSWSFSLLTRQWTTILSWTFDLFTRQWNPILFWTFNPITREWVSTTTLIFNLISLGWHNIIGWIFNLSTTKIEVLFIGIIVCLSLLFIIMFLALSDKKRKEG